MDKLLENIRSKYLPNASTSETAQSATSQTNSSGGDALLSDIRGRYGVTNNTFVPGTAKSEVVVPEKEKPAAGNRVGNVVSGALKTSAGQYAGAARAQYEAGQGGRTQRNVEQMKELQWAVAKAKADYDSAVAAGQSPGMVQASKNELDTYTTRLKAYADVLGEGVYDTALAQANEAALGLGRGESADALYKALGNIELPAEGGIQQQATKATSQLVNDINASAQEDIAEAKEGLGATGQFLVDFGVGATQLAADAAANIAAPGMSQAALVQRVFGGAAHQAEQAGASLGKQFAYGTAAAALELALEKISGSLDLIYGEGFADEVVENLVNKIAKSSYAKTALRLIANSAGESLEEAASAIISPALESIYNGKKVGENYDKDTLANAFYDALLGGALGLGGGAVNVAGTSAINAINNRTSSNSSQTEAANTGNATAESTTDESGAEAIVEPATEQGKDALETVLLDSVSPTARQINEIAKDPAQLARLGIDPNGKTASQLRAEVREALEQRTTAPVAEAPVAETAAPVQQNVEQTITQPSVNVEADAGNTVGAAKRGFETPKSVGKERTSNINSGVAEYNALESSATGKGKEDYDAMFRYTSQPEAQSRQQADNVIYVEVDGERVFLREYDADAYKDIVKYLTDARAWDGEMTDMAMMIKNELRILSMAGEIANDEYVSWLDTMRERATATGQGVQAWAKWTRTDNDGGGATEAAAWRILKESKLSKERQSEIFNAIVKFDQRIEDAKYSTDLREIILEIAGQRGTINGLTGKQSKVLTSVAKNALDGLSFHQLQQLAYSSSAALATDTTSIDIGKKLKTIQVLNMMSNTKTATANLGGNSTFYALDSLSMRGAALLDMALSKLTGTRSIAFEKSVLSKDVRDSIAEAINLSLAEVTLDVDMGGSNRYQLDGGRTFRAKGVGILNTDTKVDKFAERVYSVIERNMNYLMRTSDEAFKGAARGTAKATQALVESGKIKNAYDSYAKDTAENLALYRTFQNDGKVAATLQCIHDVLNLIGIGDSGKRIARKNGGNGFTVHSFGVGDLVAPFTRVAANLASVGVDYSPINIIKGTGEIINQVYRAASKKTVQPWKQSKAVSDLARGLTGTAIAWGVSALAKAGLIRRAKDEDKEDVAALNQSEGMVGTQVDIDALDRWLNGGSAEWKYGDTLIDMSRLEPLNFILSLGVKLADNEDDEGILSVLNPALFDPAMNAVETAGDLPVLSTVGGFVEDVKVYNTPVFEALAESLGKSAISSVTPNIVAAFAKGIDDKQRNVYGTDKEGFAGVGDVLLNTLLSRIPGARETLPTTVNSLGEEKDNEGTLLGRLTASMLNPLGVNEYTQSKFSQEMERLRELTGETGFYPENKKPSTLSYTDKNDKKHEVTLTYKQKQDYQTVRGNTHLKIGDDMLNNKHYQSADTAMQTALLQRVHDYAREVAKMSVLGEDAGQSWVVNSKNAKKDLGISQTDFFYYYEKYGSDLFANGDTYNKTKRMVASGLTIDQWAKMQNEVDANNNKYPSKSETEAYIEANFPSSQWYTIFNAFNSNWNNPY